MPIIQDDDLVNEDFSNEIESSDKILSITSKSNKSIVTDNRYTPRLNLLTHISGSSWTVTYYSQVLNKDSIVSNQQLSVSAINQQYRKISNLELKVTSPLSSSQDESTKSMSSSGEAMLYPYIVPQDGDAFIADIGNGKDLIFIVTRTTKLSLYKDACFQINYISDSESIDKINDLNNKTIENLFYNKDLIKYGKYPIIITSDYNDSIELNQLYYNIVDYYFNKFYSKEYKTLLLPNQLTPTYDHFLVSFILSIFDTSDSDNIKNIIKYNVQDDDNLDSISIFTLIRDRDISKLDLVFKTYGIVYAKQFSKAAKSSVITYSGIDKVIYPISPNSSLDNINNSNKIISIATLNVLEPKVIDIPSPDNLLNIPIPPLIKYTPNIGKVDYIFTTEFYTNLPTMSILERLVIDYISNKSISLNQLYKTLSTIRSLGLLEQFYFIPILLRITKTILNGDN